MARRVLCLDWDKRSLRLVVARVGGGRTVLEDAHSHRLPNTVDADDPQVLGEFIRQMLKRHRLHHRRAVVDVPRERAVINRLALPPTPTAEVAAAVRFQAMKELPFPVESAAIDYVIMERDEKGLAVEVLLAAVTKETLERVKATCEAAGLAPARIGLRPYANLLSVRHVHDDPEQRVLMVDVGPGATEIDVVCGDALVFSRSANVNVPLPARDVTEHDDSSVIPMPDAADLDSSDAAVESATEELLVEVMRTLQAYRASESDATIDHVMVAGGTGIESQFADRLNQRLGYPASLFDPTGPLDVDPGNAPKLRSFSAALGLAWGLGREELLALDFLNPKQPVSARDVLRRRLRMAGLAAVLVLVATGGTIIKFYQDRAGRLAAITDKNNELWEDVKARTEVANRVSEAEEWAVEVVWPEELLTLTQLALDPGQRMLVQEVAFDIASRNPGITLRKVYVEDWEVPTDFVKSLAKLTVDGTHPYEARQETWNPVEGARFHGSTDIHIGLRELREYRENAKQRIKERRALLRNP